MRAKRQLQQPLTDIASEVRDTAIQKGLNEKQTKALVLDNLALKTADDLLLDGLRKPMEEITIDNEYIEINPAIGVVAVKLTKPLATLSKTQSTLCSELRLGKKNRRVLLRSKPETLIKIEALKNVVETHQAATLPFDASDLLS